MKITNTVFFGLVFSSVWLQLVISYRLTLSDVMVARLLVHQILWQTVNRRLRVCGWVDYWNQ